MAEAVKSSYRMPCLGYWPANAVGSTGKTKSHVDICNEARRKLTLLSMPADLIKKSKIFDRKYKCFIYERENAVEYENALNRSIIKCYTGGSKIYGKVGAGFYVEYPPYFRITEAFHLRNYSTVFQAEK